MRDTVGAIHNLQHLLGSMRVGPKALSRAVPDVQGSCEPMIAAMADILEAVRGGPLEPESSAEVGALVTGRLRGLERALGRAREGSIRASDRLRLEGAMTGIVRDLDAVLALVELLVEASAAGTVPVDVSDVIRECTLRREAGTGGAGHVSATFTGPDTPISVLVNPRLSLRLLSLAAALTADREGGVQVTVRPEAELCRFELTPGVGPGTPVLIAAPQLTPLSARWGADIARMSGATLSVQPGLVLLTLPRAIPE